jgi:nicotinamidase-related amidase
MPHDTVDPAKTALLFFDMLNAYFRGSTEANQRQMEPVVANCVKIRAAADAAGIPVFYAKADHRPDGLDSGHILSDTDYTLTPWPDPDHGFTTPYRTVAADDWRGEVIDELKPAPGDYVIAKHRWSAFHQTNLELSFRSRGIDTILVCGGATHIGVASTAYDARDLDFNQVIVRDACSGLEDNLRQFMERIFPIFARIRTTEEAIGMVQAGATVQ